MHYEFSADLVAAARYLLSFLLEISTPPLCDILKNEEVLKHAIARHTKWTQLLQQQATENPGVIPQLGATIDIKLVDFCCRLSPVYYHHAMKVKIIIIAIFGYLKNYLFCGLL